jgi:hypothetical protein
MNNYIQYYEYFHPSNPLNKYQLKEKVYYLRINKILQ